jgi:hypothetical protein
MIGMGILVIIIIMNQSEVMMMIVMGVSTEITESIMGERKVIIKTTTVMINFKIN